MSWFALQLLQQSGDAPVPDPPGCRRRAGTGGTGGSGGTGAWGCDGAVDVVVGFDVRGSQ